MTIGRLYCGAGFQPALSLSAAGFEKKKRQAASLHHNYT
jgi:hypothetical protein